MSSLLTSMCAKTSCRLAHTDFMRSDIIDRGSPEGLLVVPLSAGEQLRGATPALLVIVPLLQIHLGVLGVGEGDAHHNDRPGIGICKVQTLRHLAFSTLLVAICPDQWQSCLEDCEHLGTSRGLVLNPQ